MAAFGRKQPLNFADFRLIERPLLVKADIQLWALEKLRLNVRYTLKSKH